MILTPAAVREQIASGSPDPVYLLQGEDEAEKSELAAAFAELVDEGIRAFNVERIHAGDMTSGDRLAAGVDALVSAARTLPMMAPRRVVVVMQAEAMLAPKRESEAAARALRDLEALIARPEPMTTLVFVAATLDRRTKMWKALQKHAAIVACGIVEDVAAAQQWIRRRVAAEGVEIEPDAARTLAELAGFPPRPSEKGPQGDLGRLRGEVERLLLYALGQKTITVADARALAGPAALRDDWAITNAIEAGKAADALRQLALLLETGAPPEKILGQLAWAVRAKFPAAAPDELPAAVDALFRTDLDLKRTAGDPRLLLERLVVELCAGKRMAVRRW